MLGQRHGWAGFLSLSLALSGCTAVQDQDRKSAKDFDEDGSKTISAMEARRAFEYLAVGKHADGDGELGNKELEAAVASRRKKIAREFRQRRGDYEDRNIARSVEEFDQFFFETDGSFDLLDGVEILRGLQLRRSVPDNPLDGRGQPGFRRAKAALFSYARERDSDTDKWTARGALSYPLFLVDPAGQATKKPAEPDSALEYLTLTPSVALDRATNDKDKAKETNDIVYRLAAQAWIAHGQDIGSVLDAAAAYASDFDGDSGVVAGELEWRLVLPPLGIGASRLLPCTFEMLEYRAAVAIHGEHGDVRSTGGRPELMMREDFTRWGPRVRIEIFPTSPTLDKLSARMSWAHYETVSGRTSNSRMVEADLAWQLDKDGHLSIDLSYRNGDTPLLNREIDEVVLGLGVKF